jgi:class 3 adenylate cyclase
MSDGAGTLGFGARLRHYRLAAGLTQAALAERAGLSTRGIQHLEAGEARPYRRTLERLAHALRLAPEEQAGLDAVATPRPRLQPLSASAGRSDRPLAPAAAVSPRPVTLVQRKPVTVLCAGLANFHALRARLDPASLDALLDEWVRHVVREVEQYGGTPYQVQTAAVVALFGAPLGLEDHAARALHAAVGMREVVAASRAAAAQRWEVAPHLRLGVATGPLVVRLADDGFLLEEPLAECPTAIAAVLQRFAPHDAIWASEATQRLARREFVWQPLGPLALRGQPSRVPAYRLVGLAPASETFAVDPHGRPTRFVGREGERQQLGTAWERARTGHGGVILLSGAPGIGKSRLLHEFARQVERHGGRALAVDCTAQADRAPYRPFLQLVWACSGLAHPPADAAVRARLAEWLGELPGLPAAAQARLGELLGLRQEGERPVDLPPHRLRQEYAQALQQFFLAGELLVLRQEGERPVDLPPHRLRREYAQALRQFFLAVARREPLVLVLDNAQEVDPLSLTVLGLLAEAIADVGILLVLAYRALPLRAQVLAGPAAQLSAPRRAALLRALRARPTTVRVALAALSVADSRAMLADLLASAKRPADLDTQIVRRAGGNPLYVEALAAAWLDEGARAPHDEPGASVLPTPPLTGRVLSTLLAQVDRLPPPLPAVLQAAAAIGPTFGGSALTRLAPADAVSDWALLTLESLGLLRTTTLAPEWQYAFADALLQQALASTLTAQPADQQARRAGTPPWPAASSGPSASGPAASEMEGTAWRADGVSPLAAGGAGQP